MSHRDYFQVTLFYYSGGTDSFGSGEEQCESLFVCNNDQEICQKYVCNGVYDCSDGSDEIHCE